MKFEPALQAKLDHLARESGRAAADLVHDAVAGYVDEHPATRQMLDSRYDGIKSGKGLNSLLREKSHHAITARAA